MSDGATLAPMLSRWGRAPMVPTAPTILPEFKGKARALIARVRSQAPTIVREVEALYAPLRLRAQRHQAQQVHELSSAVRQFRALPAFGVLQMDIKLDTARRRLDIWELRLNTVSFTKKGWHNPHEEPALAIDLLEVQASKGYARLHCPTLALVSMHALSRWFQHSFAPKEDELLADLALIAGDVPELLESTRTHHLAQWARKTPAGKWVGEACKYQGRMLLTCDTYFDDDNWNSGEKQQWLSMNQ
jgi:hypothetical protein